MSTPSAIAGSAEGDMKMVHAEATNAGSSNGRQYTVGKVRIYDFTNDIVKVALVPTKTPEEYVLTVDKRPVIYPKPCEKTVIFYDLAVMRFHLNGQNFLQIFEDDISGNTCEYYVDISEKTERAAYHYFFTYKPVEQHFERAQRKFHWFLKTYADFKNIFAIFNRHGIVIFGKMKEQYAVFWRRPTSKKFKGEAADISPTSKKTHITLSFKNVIFHVNWKMDMLNTAHPFNVPVYTEIRIGMINGEPAIDLGPGLIK